MNQDTAQKLLMKIKNDYELIAVQFSETRQLPWKEMHGFKKYVKENDRILDLGCGNGRLYEIFKDLSIYYTGVDISEKMIKIAEKKWGESEKIKFLIGDIVNFDWWKGERYHVIFLIGVLHHIPSQKLREKVLQNIYNALEKNGLLIMMNWNLYQLKYIRYILKNFLLKIFGQSNLDFGDALIPWHDPRTGKVLVNRYCHTFTLRELKQLVKKVGFIILENFYSRDGKKSYFWNGKNLVTIVKK